MSLHKKKLTKEVKNIKKYAKFGLIQISLHAKERMKERNIDERLIQIALSYNSTIVQDRPVGNYNTSPFYDRFVIQCKYNKIPYHVVIEKQTRDNHFHLYKMITCYRPDEGVFRKDGTLRKRSNRKSLNARTILAPAS